jgi:DNA topoisomerase-1
MKSKTLVIVESPAKAKTINKYLGKDYVVEASVGHIKDLISYKLGVDVKKNFEPYYSVIRGKAQVIKRLKTSAEAASNVLIATDPDREGEAIAWHIAEEVREKNPKIQRVLFNEITKNGVANGLKAPRALDENLFMSQQARRVMDRLIGFKVSPFLSNTMLTKTTKALSAGRVQSVALRLICEREKHIQEFVPIDYWSIFGTFSNAANASFKARLVAFDKKNIKNPEGSAGSTEEERENTRKILEQLHYIKSEEQATELISKILAQKYEITNITKKSVNRNPQPPFTTSSIQQEASRRLGFSNSKTMSLAQRLYEGVTIGKEGSVGLITYMRTDSVRLSPESQTAAREFIGKQYGSEFLPIKPPVYTSKSANVQDAHEAIRPTSLDYRPEEMKKILEKDLANLYELIYNRFIASQMNPAVVDLTSVSIEGGNFAFRANGSVITFKGFLVVYEDVKDELENGDKEDGSMLPEGLVISQKLNLNSAEKTKSQTKSKPRYNEASLVKELDELGIGRPSTYATIVSTLIEREYVDLQKKVFYASKLGMDVNAILVEHFPELFNVDFTAEMEQELDTIAEGKKTYVEVLKNFYQPFEHSLRHAEAEGNKTEIACDLCGAPMIIRVSRNGRFLGCSRYPECKNTKPLPKDESKEKAEPVIAEGVFCDLCGKPMVIRDSRYGKFYGCIDYPTCKGTKPISTAVTCPKCKQGTLIARFSPRSKKKFWGCSRYPDCDYLTNYEPILQKCSNCGHPFLEIRYKKNGSEWDKYLRCPECTTVFEIEKKVEENAQ